MDSSEEGRTIWAVLFALDLICSSIHSRFTLLQKADWSMEDGAQIVENFTEKERIDFEVNPSKRRWPAGQTGHVLIFGKSVPCLTSKTWKCPILMQLSGSAILVGAA